MNAYNFDSLAVLPSRAAMRAPKGKTHKRHDVARRESPAIIRERALHEARKAKRAYV